MRRRHYSEEGHFTIKVGKPSAVFPMILSPHGARSVLIVDGDKIWWLANEMRDWSFLHKAVGPSFMPNFEEASEHISKNWEKLVALADLGGGDLLILRQGSLQADVVKSTEKVTYCPKESKPICKALSVDEHLTEKEVTKYTIRAYVLGYPFEEEK